MLFVGNVKKVVKKIDLHVRFLQSVFRFSFVKVTQFAQTGNLFFDGCQLFLVSIFAKWFYQ